MYGNPFVPAKYPEWYTAIINFCLEHIPSTQRHANFVRPSMRDFITAIYTLYMLFFIPIAINWGLINHKKVPDKRSWGKVKKIGPKKHSFYSCFAFLFAVLGLFYFGLDQAPRPYDLSGGGVTMMNTRWSYTLFFANGAFILIGIIGAFIHMTIKYIICALDARRKVVNQGAKNELSNEPRHQ